MFPLHMWVNIFQLLIFHIQVAQYFACKYWVSLWAILEFVQYIP